MRLLMWMSLGVVMYGCDGAGSKDDGDDTDATTDDTDTTVEDTVTDTVTDDTDTTSAPQNTAPTVAAPVVDRMNPWNDQLLTATASTQDPDGDSVSLRWVWTNDRTGAQVGTAQQLQLSAAIAAPADLITVEVFADDGQGGVSSASSQVVVANRAPTVQTPLMTPGQPLDNSVIRCAATAQDADQDALVVQTSWTLNGAPATDLAGALDATLHADDVVSCAVTATDPQGAAATSAWVTATVQSSYVAPRFDTDGWTSLADALTVDCAGSEINLLLRTVRWGYATELYVADTRYTRDYGEQHTMDETDLSPDATGYSVFERALTVGVPLFDQQPDVSTLFTCDWFALNDMGVSFAAVVRDDQGAIADCITFGQDPEVLLDRGIGGGMANMPAWMDRATCRNVNP